MPCETCGRAVESGEKHKATQKRPSIATMARWMDSGIARATDGCKVEPDGKCPHGHSSWMLILGLI